MRLLNRLFNMNLFKDGLNKGFIKLSVLISLIYFMLELYYYFFITKGFSHLGYSIDVNTIKYVLTKLIFIGLLSLSYLLFKKSSFLYSIYLLLIFFFYIPNAILFSLANSEYNPFFCNVFFISSFISSAYFNIKLPQVSLFDRYKSAGILGLSFLILIPIVYTFKSNVNWGTLILMNIYETRVVFSEKLVGSLSYLYHLSIKTILPIALIYFMIKKKPVLIAMCFFALLYLFVISGNRFVYFTSMILIYFYYFGKDYISKIKYFFTITIILFIAFPFIDYFIIRASNPILIGTFVNRFLFTPAILTQWYFEFFEGKPFYFAESHFFNKFIHSPYDMPIGFLISKVYLNAPTVYANNGIVSDGYMNLGYYGVTLYSIVFSFLFGLFNSLNLNKGYFGLFFSLIYMFLSVPFLSCFITGGVLFFLIIAFFFLREK